CRHRDVIAAIVRDANGDYLKRHRRERPASAEQIRGGGCGQCKRALRLKPRAEVGVYLPVLEHHCQVTPGCLRVVSLQWLFLSMNAKLAARVFDDPDGCWQKGDRTRDMHYSDSGVTSLVERK